VLLVVALLATVVVAPACASQLIDRDAQNVQLAVNDHGQALLTYVTHGLKRHVLVTGGGSPYAVPPKQGAKQIEFTVDYSGGYHATRKELWKTFKNACQPYDGPNLHWPWTFIGSKAPDGSYWAVQMFPQPLPDLGFTPWTDAQQQTWLELSHWGADLPKVEAYQDWVYGGRFNEIFGRMTYRGTPVYGFSTSKTGVPLGTFGALVYLDTFNSVYGNGWRRENSYVVNKPNGVFCYGFYSFDPIKQHYDHPPSFLKGLRGPGVGTRYRLIANGPGVLPDVLWQGKALHRFRASNKADAAYETRAIGLMTALAGSDSHCLKGHS
jgi:hypothetical protein